MTYIDHLLRLHQEHLLQYPLPEKTKADLALINWNTLETQLRDFVQPSRTLSPASPTGLSPHSIHPVPFLYKKRLGLLIMAGGQATRLKSALPKGLIPFSPISQKSIFQILAEKVLAFSQCYDTTVHVGIMTSDATNGQTRAHFSLHENFSLPHVDFFLQDSLPLLDMDKKLILHQDHILKGPDGNGRIFQQFATSGLLDTWVQDGIEAISIINCDNPLIDPFHPGLLYSVFQGHDLAAAAVERTDPAEHVGLFVTDKGRLAVVEYSEIDPKKASERDDQGRLLFRWANISFFVCLPKFAQKAAGFPLPLHMAKKVVYGKETWKSEYFIFDILSCAQNPSIVPIDRASYFAPVKSATGPTSLIAAQKAWIERDAAFKNQVKETKEWPDELPQSAFYPKKSSF